jgi:hypothetical protein
MARHRNRRTPHASTGISGLVVQLLTTEWTKESRGGPGARLRSTTPRARVLPEAWLGPEDGTLRIHHIYYSERNQFLPREGSRIRSGRSLFEEVEAFRVERTEEGVRVLLDHGRMGLPGAHEWSWEMARGNQYEELLSVAPGEWGRAVYNERLSYWDTGNWGYCKHVLNVGLLRDASPDVFLATEPEHEAVREFLLRQSGSATAGSSSARIDTAAP